MLIVYLIEEYKSLFMKIKRIKNYIKIHVEKLDKRKK